MTLTQTAVVVKQAFFLLAIFIIISAIAFVGYQAAYNYSISRRPPPEEKPDVKYGQLPPLDLPPSIFPSSNFTYSLDTVTGNLPRLEQDPNFRKIVKVYYINKSVVTLLSPDRSFAFAQKFGINTPPQILSEILYRYFQDGKTLTVELDTQNFKYANTKVPPSNEILPDDNSLINGFRGILANAGVLNEELRDGSAKVTLLKEENGKLKPTKLRTEARFTHVSLWPKAIDGKLIYSPKFNVSLISALTAGSTDNIQNYMSIEYTYWLVDKSTFATYPAKSLEKAFEELKAGQGTVVISPQVPNASITSVSAGYYLPEKYAPFLQPIYVFEGPEFAAYTSAIDTTKVSPTQNLNKPTQ